MNFARLKGKLNKSVIEMPPHLRGVTLTKLAEATAPKGTNLCSSLLELFSKAFFRPRITNQNIIVP